MVKLFVSIRAIIPDVEESCNFRVLAFSAEFHLSLRLQLPKSDCSSNYSLQYTKVRIHYCMFLRREMHLCLSARRVGTKNSAKLLWSIVQSSKAYTDHFSPEIEVRSGKQKIREGNSSNGGVEWAVSGEEQQTNPQRDKSDRNILTKNLAYHRARKARWDWVLVGRSSNQGRATPLAAVLQTTWQSRAISGNPDAICDAHSGSFRFSQRRASFLASFKRWFDELLTFRW